MPERVIKLELPNFTKLEELFSRYKLYQAVGCQRCENTGYSSRISIAEVLEIDEKLKQMINDGDSSVNEEVVRGLQDFISIKQDGIIKVLQGITTMEEVLRVIES